MKTVPLAVGLDMVHQYPVLSVLGPTCEVPADGAGPFACPRAPRARTSPENIATQLSPLLRDTAPSAASDAPPRAKSGSR